tara:strand:+ start:605 stop:1825 length:1221 start_codon:yes stop_codon:yes gene_type:complete
MNCRHCGEELGHVFLDLGFTPPSNAYLTDKQLSELEVYIPLKVLVCDVCWLVQTKDYSQANELFTESYAYFSSTSSSWLKHAENYYKMITEKLQLDIKSLVVEIASNDGYLLKNFLNHKINCLGIEPTKSTADAARNIGIPVLQKFFNEELACELAEQGKQADLIIGNNVYAHVPDINDFTRGLRQLLKPEGTITLEFPHVMRLIDLCQFDTVYHEHFSYLSLTTVNTIFSRFDLRIYNVEKLTTHGGSLRIFACHKNASIVTQESVVKLMISEQEKGIKSLAYYQGLRKKVERIKNDLLLFLIDKKNKNEKIVAYGAAAKGNTLLNYAGIKSDLLPVVYDAAEFKQGKYLPGSHIEIQAPNRMLTSCFDYVLILPWNIKDEIKQQLESSGIEACFVTAIPHLEII